MIADKILSRTHSGTMSEDSKNERISWYVNPGSISSLKKKREKIIPPGPGEIQIEVKAIGLNFADFFACQGLYEAAPTTAFIPGLEFAGVIYAIGEDTEEQSHNFKIGQRVCGASRFGSFTTHVTIIASVVRPLPDDWSFEEGSAFPVNALTAYYGLNELARMEHFSKDKKQCVLIHSGAGGVGSWAISMALATGCDVITTVGTKTKIDFLMQKFPKLHKECILVRSQASPQKLVNNALKFLGRTHLNIIFDSLLEPGYFKVCSNLMQPRGNYIVYGAGHFATDFDRPNWLQLGWRWLFSPMVDPMAWMPRNRNLCCFNLIYLWDDYKYLCTLFDKIQEADYYKPVVGCVFKFDDLPNAIRKLRGGKTKGKVVVSLENLEKT